MRLKNIVETGKNSYLNRLFNIDEIKNDIIVFSRNGKNEITYYVRGEFVKVSYKNWFFKFFKLSPSYEPLYSFKLLIDFLNYEKMNWSLEPLNYRGCDYRLLIRLN